MIVAALIAVVAVVVAVRFWPGDEREIHKKIALIESLASKDADEKPFDSLLRARDLAALFHDPCILQVESADFRGEYSRKHIQDRIVMVRGSFTRVKVSVHDPVIDLPEKNNAKLRCTLRVKGEGNSRPVADVQELQADLHKVEGDWMFTTLTLVEVLER
jgi:hypothetical protein